MRFLTSVVVFKTSDDHPRTLGTISRLVCPVAPHLGCRSFLSADSEKTSAAGYVLARGTARHVAFDVSRSIHVAGKNVASIGSNDTSCALNALRYE